MTSSLAKRFYLRIQQFFDCITVPRAWIIANVWIGVFLFIPIDRDSSRFGYAIGYLMATIVSATPLILGDVNWSYRYSIERLRAERKCAFIEGWKRSCDAAHNTLCLFESDLIEKDTIEQYWRDKVFEGIEYVTEGRHMNGDNDVNI